jgi:DNA-binding NtrC family response regulator
MHSSYPDRCIVVFSARKEVILFCKGIFGDIFRLFIYPSFFLPEQKDVTVPEAVLVDPEISVRCNQFELDALITRFYSVKPVFIVPQNELSFFLSRYRSNDFSFIPIPCDPEMLRGFPFFCKKTSEEEYRPDSECPAVAASDIAGLHEMIGESVCMKSLKHKIAFIAKEDVTVLLQGETGTGKTFAADLIHALSKRKGKRFCTINMSTVPENLADSELFGTVRGAFTGAVEHSGIFGAADGGTLFLDEIGNTPLSVQAKLLRVLETYHYRSIGSAEEKKTDVRLIFATNTNLKALISRGEFRLDLYNRMNIIPLVFPSLRDHKEDIPLLVDDILKKQNKKITDKAKSVLMKYDWPGNIRQLIHCLKRASLFCNNDVITACDIFID